MIDLNAKHDVSLLEIGSTCYVGIEVHERIDDYDLPKGLYAYQLRENPNAEYDECFVGSVENFVFVNFCGTFITKTPISEVELYDFAEVDAFYHSGEVFTISELLENELL